MKLHNTRKSTYSDDKDCVEVGRGMLGGEDVSGIQDTKQSNLGDSRNQLIASLPQYGAFVSALRAGKFDRPQV